MSKPKEPKQLSFIELYEKAVKEGEERFGYDCPHAETKDGVCLKCLRRVLDDNVHIST